MVLILDNDLLDLVESNEINSDMEGKEIEIIPFKEGKQVF